MTDLPVKPGIDGIPTGLIPTDPAAFVDWFKNSFLPRWAANADIRNATAGTGVKISGTTDTPGFVGFEEIAGNSVLGNPTGIEADVEAITASADGQVLQRAGGVLLFAPTSVVSDNSVSGTGTPLLPLQLVNDVLAPGASQAYSTNSSGVKGWFAASSGNALGNITTDSHPAIPTGVGLGPNDEFETGASIDTAGTRYPGAVAWTGFNISTATNQVNNGALVLRPVNSGGLTINGYVQTVILAGTWTYEAKVTSANLTANGAVGLIAGAAGGKFIFFNISGTGGAVMNVQAFTNATTFSTTQQALGTVVALGSYIYLQISYNGTNLIFSYSASGTPGSFINGFSQTPAFFLGAVPTVIGIAGSLQNTTQGQLICDWFRQIA